MSVAKHITLTAGSTSIDISVPVYGYKTTIDMALDVVKLNSGKYATRAEAATYDKRYCDCQLYLDITDQLAFTDFFNTDSASTARGEDCVLTMSAGSGFFPFGPDRGDAGPFTVAVEVIDPGPISAHPWRTFTPKIRITNTGAWPSYTLPTEVDEGPCTIGTVDGLRFPQEMFGSVGQYADHQTMMESGAVQHVDRGALADSYTTTWGFSGNVSKSAAVLAYLTGTARAANTSFVVPSHSHPFGFDLGDDGTFSVNLINGKIEVIHEMSQRFHFDLQFGYVSGPT
jgi:hypothetical protein